MVRIQPVRQPTNHPTYWCVSFTFGKMFASKIRHLYFPFFIYSIAIPTMSFRSKSNNSKNVMLHEWSIKCTFNIQHSRKTKRNKISFAGETFRRTFSIVWIILLMIHDVNGNFIKLLIHLLHSAFASRQHILLFFVTLFTFATFHVSLVIRHSDILKYFWRISTH